MTFSIRSVPVRAQNSVYEHLFPLRLEFFIVFEQKTKNSNGQITGDGYTRMLQMNAPWTYTMYPRARCHFVYKRKENQHTYHFGHFQLLSCESRTIFRQF